MPVGSPGDTMDVSNFLQSLTAWVEARSDILALAVVGSHARGSARLDSDLDLVMLCEQPEILADDPSWVERFGPVRTASRERWGRMRAWRVFYDTGLEVEFGLNPLDWADVPLDPGTRRVISDGMQIRYDPRGTLQRAQEAALSGDVVRAQPIIR